MSNHNTARFALLGLVIAGVVFFAVLNHSPAEPTEPPRPTPLDTAIAAATNSSALAPDEPEVPSDFRLRVYHKHQFGNCDGVLSINAQRIRYATSHTEDAFQFPRKELRLDDDGFIDPSGRSWHFSSPYGDVREVMRKWLGGSAQAQSVPAESLSDVAPSVDMPESAASRTLTVKHKHFFGSCDGVLNLSPSAIAFEARDRKDSFTLAIDQAELDGDGVKDRSGKSWHFKGDNVNLTQILAAWKRQAP